jgi:hypothetical protein
MKKLLLKKIKGQWVMIPEEGPSPREGESGDKG